MGEAVPHHTKVLSCGTHVHTDGDPGKQRPIVGTEKGMFFSKGEGRKYPTNACQDKRLLLWSCCLRVELHTREVPHTVWVG